MHIEARSWVATLLNPAAAMIVLSVCNICLQGQNPGGGLPWMPVSGPRQQAPSLSRPADMAPAASLASNGLGSRGPGAAIAAGARRRPRQPLGGRAAGGPQLAAKGTLKAASATANPAGSLHNTLAKNTPLFRSLFTVLDISADQVPASAVGTFFAPSDDVSSSNQWQALLQRFNSRQGTKQHFITP